MARSLTVFRFGGLFPCLRWKGGHSCLPLDLLAPQVPERSSKPGLPHYSKITAEWAVIFMFSAIGAAR